ncbi:MAG: putative ABC transporter permease [Coriobacteriales bacterium]|nr:putative ABC transporter permease [Coriobacteriales bacterium]
MRRYRFTKYWAIAGALFNIVVVTAYNLFSGRLTGGDFASAIALQLLSAGWDVVVFLYFLRSKRVELLMVRELDLTVRKNAVELNRHGWPYFRNLLLYYCVFSTLGHWMEAGFCKLIDLGVFAGDPGYDNTMLWRDWLYPFPMHGIAVVLIVVILYPLKEKVRSRLDAIPTIAVMFVVNMVICTGIEFVGGLMFNANLQNWNYSDLPFSFMGQICLQNALGFGFAATIVEYVIYPTIERLIARVPNELMNTICVGVFSFYAILTALYVVDFSPEAAAANAVSHLIGTP